MLDLLLVLAVLRSGCYPRAQLGEVYLPRYDYECDTCHHVFELKQSFDSEPVATCPQCENSARRKFHSVPVVFKGSGWYVNDYGKRGTGAGAPVESKESEPAAESAKSDGDGDAKPASKTEAKSDSKAEGGSGATDSSNAKAKPETSKAKSD